MSSTPNPFSDAAANPYQSPTFEASSAAGPLVPFTRQEARLRLLGPAIGLILFAVLWLTYMALVTFVLAFDVRRIHNGANDEIEALGRFVGWAIGMALFTIPSIVTLAGGVQMLRVKTYGFCWLTAIVAVAPCTFCFPVLLPFGIWGIVALYDARMRPAFGEG